MDNKNILRKYFHHWTQYTKSKNNAQYTEIKNEKINNFMEQLMRYKKDLTENKTRKGKSQIFNSETTSKTNKPNCGSLKYSLHLGNIQNRFQVQKNIIALQKTKLEQQERFIEELKLNRLVEDAGYSAAVIVDVRKTLSQCEKAVRPKLKCIVGDITQQEIACGEDDLYRDAFEISCLKVPKFLQKMEHRARAREEKRAIVTERRRQIELERERIKEQLLISRQLLDQEEKNKRMKEFKEKRQQEQLIAIRNKQWRERITALTVMADLHYEKKIIVKYGIQNFKMYIVKLKNDFQFASSHYDKMLLRKHFSWWRNFTEDIVAKKNFIACNMYEQKLKHWIFQTWKFEYKIMVNKRQVAEDWYDFHITERLFIEWRLNASKIKKLTKWQWNLAIQHNNTRMKWRAIGLWQTLPTINAIEKEREARKQRWRSKVLQVIPDFIPRDVD